MANLTKKEIWEEMEELLQCENVSMTDLFNYFSSNDLQGFLEFLKDEMEG
jgi:hypothetical protein